MLTLKCQKHVGIIFLTVTLALLLFAEPLLAKKARGGGGKPSGGGGRSQAAAKASASSGARSSPGIRASQTRSSSTARVAKSRPASMSSRSVGQGASSRAVGSSIRQPSSGMSSRQPSRMQSRRFSGVTSSRAATKPRNVTSRTSKSSGRYVNVQRSVEVSSSVGKQASVSSRGSIGFGKTTRLGSSIGGQGSSLNQGVTESSPRRSNIAAAKVTKSSSSSIFARLGSIVKKPEKKTSQVYTGSVIKAEKKTSSVTAAKLNRSSGSGVGAAKATKSGSGTILRKSESIVVQPKKSSKSSRGQIGQTVKAEKKTFAVAKGKASRMSKPSVAVSQASKSGGGKVVKKADSIIIAQFEKKANVGRVSTGQKTVKANNKTFAAAKAKNSGGSKSNAGVSRASKGSVGKAQKKTDSIIIAQPEKKGKTSRGQTHQVTKANNRTSGSTVTKASRVSKSKGGGAKTGKSNGSKGVRRAEPAGTQRGSVSKSSGKRTGTVIKADRKTTVATKKATRGGKSGVGTAKAKRSGSGLIVSKSGSVVKQAEKRTRVSRGSTGTRKWGGSQSSSGKSLRTGPVSTRAVGEKSQHRRMASRKVLDESRPVVSRSREVIGRRRKQLHSEDYGSTQVYREVTDVVGHVGRHEHVYVDYHDRICHRRTWPGYHFALYYHWGPWYTYRYFYPYYHRRYVFVSLGGYWPIGCRYMRYYWYGYHPYYWYGYYPIAREIGGDTYNYYTYNYYYDGYGAYDSGQAADGVGVVDHTTFADVRERLAQQEEGPYEETLADRYFEDAVQAFENGDYDTAVELFAETITLAPDDMIVPFAYCQSLFANERYTEAAEVLRVALAKVSPEKEGVFYPRGLYTEEDVLYEQIDRLAETAELYGFDGDLQLLLGYHLLGIGEIDEAIGPLRFATQDLKNASSAAVLLRLAEKMRIENAVGTGD